MDLRCFVFAPEVMGLLQPRTDIPVSSDTILLKKGCKCKVIKIPQTGDFL